MDNLEKESFMSEVSEQIEFNLAHDGGNGYMKDRLNGQTTIFPSVLARFLPGMQNNIIKASDTKEVQNLLNNYLDDMDITVQSNGINSNGRYLVGKAGINSGAPLMTFNVSSVEGKSTSDISIISALSLVAYNAVKVYYEQYNNLPENLKVEVAKMATDLPIDETKNRSIRESYITRFTGNQHIVVINNFDNPITVNVTFKKAFLEAEGVVGERGLIMSPTNAGMLRDDNVFQPLIEDYQLDSFDGQDLMEAGNTIGVDIGDGTVDFSAMNGLASLPNMNDSLNTGIGNIAEEAIR